MADKQITYQEYLRLKENFQVPMEKSGGSPGGGSGPGPAGYRRHELRKEGPSEMDEEMGDEEIREYVMQLQLNLSPEEIQDIIEMDLSKKQLDKILGLHGTMGLSKGLSKLKKGFGVEDQQEMQQPIEKGGPGSGFYGHPGKPGQMGGSMHSKGATPPPKVQMKRKPEQMPVRKDYDEDGNYYDPYDYEDSNSYQEPYNNSDVQQAPDNWWEKSYASTDDGEWYMDKYGDWQRYHDEPNTVMIDQMEDSSKYAKAPMETASDEDPPTYKPGDQTAGLASDAWKYGKDFMGDSAERKPEKVEKPEVHQERDPEKDKDPNEIDAQDISWNKDGTVNVQLWDGSWQKFSNLNQAKSFYADWQDPKNAPKPPEPFSAKAKRAISNVAGDVYTNVGQLASGEMPSVISGELPSARKPKAGDVQPPADMPVHNVYPDGSVMVYDPNGQGMRFADRTSAFNYYALPADKRKPENLGWGDTMPEVTGEAKKKSKVEMQIERIARDEKAKADAAAAAQPSYTGRDEDPPIPKSSAPNTPAGEPPWPGAYNEYGKPGPQFGKDSTKRGENVFVKDPVDDSDPMNPERNILYGRFGDTSTYRAPKSPGAPGSTDPIEYADPSQKRWVDYMSGLGNPPTDDPREKERALQMPGKDDPDRKEKLKGIQARAAQTGQTIELPSLPKGENMTPEQAAAWDKRQDENLHYDEYKDRRQRKIAAEEAAAEQLQMDMESKRLQHAADVKRLERLQYNQSYGSTPPPSSRSEVEEQPRSEAKDKDNVPPRMSSKRAARPSSRSGPSSSEKSAEYSGNDLATKQNVKSLASSLGIDVREQNNKIMVQAKDGKMLQFENYAAAEDYLEGSTRFIKKAAPVEAIGVTPEAMEVTHGANDMASFHSMAEEIGAQTMMQKNGSMIVFAPNWNPPLSGKQFSNAKDAEVWLNDEYAKRGNQEPMQKNFTPLDQADTPSDTLPRVRKKSGATPQLTANLNLQESMSYAQFRSLQVRPVS